MEEQAVVFSGTRIEIGTSVKGVHTYSVTVRSQSTDEADKELLARAVALVSQLDALYPAGGMDA